LRALGAPAWLVAVTGDDESAVGLKQRLTIAAGVYVLFRRICRQDHHLPSYGFMSRHQAV